MKHCLKMTALILSTSMAFAIESQVSTPFANTKVIATFVKPGDIVSRGQLIARLDTNELKAKLEQLRADKQQIETEIQLTKKMLKKSKASRSQRIHDKEKAMIDANQIINGIGNLSSMKNKAISNQNIDNDIKSLSSSHQKQRQLHKRLNDTLKSLTASELKFEELIKSAEVTSLYDGMVLDIAHINHEINHSHQSLGTIDHA